MNKPKNYRMLCGFGGEPTIITTRSGQPLEYHCLKCDRHLLTIMEANLMIDCDFYFICYECQEQKK